MNTSNSIEQRRDFIKKSLALAGVVICGGALTSLLDSCSNSFNANPTGTATLNVSTVSGLQNDGGVVMQSFTGQFNNTQVIIIRESASSYFAFCTVCTHQGNTVNPPASSTANIICPTHGSQFSSTDGHVIKGPATSSLKKYTTTLDSTTQILTITG